MNEHEQVVQRWISRWMNWMNECQMDTIEEWIDAWIIEQTKTKNEWYEQKRDERPASTYHWCPWWWVHSHKLVIELTCWHDSPSSVSHINGERTMYENVLWEEREEQVDENVAGTMEITSTAHMHKFSVVRVCLLYIPHRGSMHDMKCWKSNERLPQAASPK